MEVPGFNANTESENTYLTKLKEHTATFDRGLEIYSQFVEEELYEKEEISNEVQEYLKEIDEEASNSKISPESLLVTELKEMYFESKELQKQYEEKELSKLKQDLDQMHEELKTARRATFKAEKAGIKNKHGAQEIDYLAPKELCLGNLIAQDKRSKNH